MVLYILIRMLELAELVLSYPLSLFHLKLIVLSGCAIVTKTLEIIYFYIAGVTLVVARNAVWKK